MSPLSSFPSASLKIEYRSPEDLSPYARNARTHSSKQIKQIARSIEQFGFTNPVLVTGTGEIIAGHGRVAAAKSLGLDRVPVLELSHLSEAQRRAYILADNKLAELAGWDRDLLAIELQGLIDLDFDLELTGFSLAEIDLTLEDAGGDTPPSEIHPARSLGPAVTQPGDLWILGPHRLLCGDARKSEDLARVMAEDRADLIFTDPPYNVAIDGHVSGLGKQVHREFACASGEMSSAEFTEFLSTTLGHAAAAARDGAIAFVCMDWRHMAELMEAGRGVFAELKNLCIWNKTNAGMGTFYRSKHELVFVYKIGTAAHVNSFGLGETGRYRTNVWDYAGANVLGERRDAELEMHPTVKPVEMIRDAIQDCSRRGESILDPFGGSGSTLMAAESCGRRARLLEYDPLYCDTILRRAESTAGLAAVNAATGERFADLVDTAQLEAVL
ncbi:site-specific DNA-methyltransferase [Aestuariibius insulae]|uniref:site-specific DNA-methyltransferase n=1 Tax=Aestuariibius insulae TaxID=2058287 RepID=UPI00345EC0FE